MVCLPEMQTMATIEARRQANGATRYTSIVRIRRGTRTPTYLAAEALPPTTLPECGQPLQLECRYSGKPHSSAGSH